MVEAGTSFFSNLRPFKALQPVNSLDFVPLTLRDAM
jgi:hypothetical protein